MGRNGSLLSGLLCGPVSCGAQALARDGAPCRFGCHAGAASGRALERPLPRSAPPLDRQAALFVVDGLADLALLLCRRAKVVQQVGEPAQPVVRLELDPRRGVVAGAVELNRPS